ncbi:MAG: hypothetical protein Q8922_03495 [Bacteroidota bacterium]|nr:hypothetical protein [Bacteroidota bacterium]MDP4233355.1 hypothetical protein [Bacteroidota bacterium]MDP4242222.1 hypothetical protein [Bacteroidota bacterium]MDP4286978.1 hypothetical protein [Bacteroidota bacterium]
MADTVVLTPQSHSLWLKSKAWDLTWISGSVLLVTIPYASYYFGQAIGLNPDTARNGVNMLVAFLIGGPHMYATHLRTTLDPEFRARHQSIYLAAFVIPAAVIYLGYYHFVFLLTFFFFWASVHVLHQIIYLVDCYNGRADDRATSRVSTFKSKAIDYSVVLTALYPVAMYRFVHGTFKVGQNTLYFPDMLKIDPVWWLASIAFATALTLYISKTYREFRTGEGNIPKTVLITVTVIASFITPMFHELDVAFQGMNTWHSFQYLGLTWYINRLRYDRGELPNKISIFSRPGEWWRYYGFNMTLNVITLLLIGTLLITKSYTGLSFDQCYYMVVLCFLLTHYYHDHIIFTERTSFASASALTAM